MIERRPLPTFGAAIAAGYTLSDLRDFDYRMDEVFEAGYTPDDLKAAGWTEGDLIAAIYMPRRRENVGAPDQRQNR